MVNNQNIFSLKGNNSNERETFSLHNENEIKRNSHLNDILFIIERKK